MPSDAAPATNKDRDTSGNPVQRFVRVILEHADRDCATGVRFSRNATQFAVELQIDGTWQQMTPPPLILWKPVTNIVLAYADLDYFRPGPKDGLMLVPGVESVWRLTAEDHRERIVLTRVPAEGQPVAAATATATPAAVKPKPLPWNAPFQPPDDLSTDAEREPILCLVDLILNMASQLHATRVRMSCRPDKVHMEYELDGIWCETECPPACLGSPLANVLQRYAGLEYWQKTAAEGLIVKPYLQSDWLLVCPDGRHEFLLTRQERIPLTLG